MPVPIYSLYWPNMEPAIVAGHKACWEKVGFAVDYTVRAMRHDIWMEELSRQLSQHEAIVFVDIDCIPYSRESVEATIEYALGHRSFLGLAQSANHIQPAKPIYAAPSYMVVSRAGYQALGRPTFRMSNGFDNAQDLSATADAIGFAYRALYPIGYHQMPAEGPWRLGNFGTYGIGTEYAGGFFHLFESRRKPSVDLFRDKVARILGGEPQPQACPYMSHALDQPETVSAPRGKGWKRQFRQLIRKI